MAERICPLCAQPLEDAHDLAQCEKAELLKGRLEIKRLKESLNGWKDAWFQLREIIGNLWWHHPAIESDKELAYYRQANAQKEEAPWNKLRLKVNHASPDQIKRVWTQEHADCLERLIERQRNEEEKCYTPETKEVYHQSIIALINLRRPVDEKKEST